MKFVSKTEKENNDQLKNLAQFVKQKLFLQFSNHNIF